MKGDSKVGKGRTGSAPAPEPATDQVYVFPLTFAQQRLLFLDQLDPTSTSYSVAWSIRMTGHLKADALERSLNEIVCRHEILRTEVPVECRQPMPPRWRRQAYLRKSAGCCQPARLGTPSWESPRSEEGR